MAINLIKMEDDKKIFVNWLKQIIKIDGLITGRKLASIIRCHRFRRRRSFGWRGSLPSKKINKDISHV